MPRGMYQRKGKTKSTKAAPKAACGKSRAKVIEVGPEDFMDILNHALSGVSATGGIFHSDPHHTVDESISPTGIDAVLKARGAEYGDFTSQAEIVQGFKDILQRMPQWKKFAPFMKEGVEMIEHKIGRAGNGNPFNPDTWEDVAGYAKLIADRIRKLPINQKPTI